MGGGLLQLKRVGQQNEYLNGNPSITFFKNVYKKHTLFAMEPRRIEFEGIQSLAYDVPSIMRCKIDRNGDLLSNVYFSMNLPDIYSGYETVVDSSGNTTGNAYEFQWIPNIGSQIINKATLTIGGTKISELYGQWIEIYHELFLDTSQKNNFDRITGHEPEMFFPAYNGINNGFYPTSSLDPLQNTNPDSVRFAFSEFAKNPFLQPPSIKGRKIYVPIPFWFSKSPGLALPLIALQYHEVHVEFECRPIIDLYTILETRPNNENIEVGTRIAPNATKDHHHIGNFITSIPNDSFNPDMSSLNDGTKNLQGWDNDCHVLANYIFLDEAERKKFALSSHDYLIEQVNRNAFTGVKGTKSLKFQFSHPVKYLIWLGQRSDVADLFNGFNNYTNYDNEYIDPSSATYIRRFGYDNADPLYYQFENGSIKEVNGIKQTLDMDSNTRALIPTKFNFNSYDKDIIKNARLLFDGVERYRTSSSKFHQSLQAFQHGVNTDKFGIQMYSFALSPSEFNPNGTCNFSRIETAELEIETIQPPAKKPGPGDEYDFNIYVYSVNQNILRIQNGMGSPVFSN